MGDIGGVGPQTAYVLRTQQGDGVVAADGAAEQDQEGRTFRTAIRFSDPAADMLSCR